MIDPAFGTEVAAGKKSNEDISFDLDDYEIGDVSDISWFDESLEENGIDKNDITEIEFTLRASDSDDWMADLYVEEKIVLNF